MGIYVILAFVLGFVLAQLLKTISFLAHSKGKSDLKKLTEYLTKSGGMPSGHSASFGAAATCIGLYYGFNSGLFALAVCTMMIVIYDAVNVRFAVGEQGKILNSMIKENDNKKHSPTRIVEGHTVFEVVVGLVLGIVIGSIIFMIFEKK